MIWSVTIRIRQLHVFFFTYYRIRQLRASSHNAHLPNVKKHEVLNFGATGVLDFNKSDITTYGFCKMNSCKYDNF